MHNSKEQEELLERILIVTKQAIADFQAKDGGMRAMCAASTIQSEPKSSAIFTEIEQMNEALALLETEYVSLYKALEPILRVEDNTLGVGSKTLSDKDSSITNIIADQNNRFRRILCDFTNLRRRIQINP